MNNSLLDIEDVLRIGKVVSVRGRSVEVLVDKSKNGSHLLFNGKLVKNISVGSYVKIAKGFESLIGKIEGEYITEDKVYQDKEYWNERDKIKRIINIKLLGYNDVGKLKQGIKDLPLIDNECYLVSEDEFEKVHYFLKEIDGNLDEEIKIGKLANEKGREIILGVNSLFASHIGIFGNTGSGKSYTLASIYHQLFKKYKTEPNFRNNAKFIFIDFNGEYLKSEEPDDIIVESQYKNTYNLSTRSATSDKFPISKNEINDNDFWAIFLTATEKTQKPFLRRALTNTFYHSRFNTIDNFKWCISQIILELVIKKAEKSDILQFLNELSNAIGGSSTIDSVREDYTRKLIWHGSGDNYYYEKANGERLFSSHSDFKSITIDQVLNSFTVDLSAISELQKTRLRIVFEYYSELAKFNLNSEHISPMIKRLKRIEDLDKIITVSEESSDKFLDIISLSEVNTTMKKVLPLLICKQVYDNKKQARDPSKYLNIVIDEAHNILSYASQRESETWKDYRLETFEEIVKEGRKFGVFLTVSSQRPYDISATIISQLHNYFLHRLINNKDIEAVERTISYLDKVSFDSLPILPTGTCVLAGLSAQIPLILEINKIPDENEPCNKTIKPTEFWS